MVGSLLVISLDLRSRYSGLTLLKKNFVRISLIFVPTIGRAFRIFSTSSQVVMHSTNYSRKHVRKKSISSPFCKVVTRPVRVPPRKVLPYLWIASPFWKNRQLIIVRKLSHLKASAVYKNSKTMHWWSTPLRVFLHYAVESPFKELVGSTLASLQVFYQQIRTRSVRKLMC